jgi:hypothetical protein
MFAAQAMDLAAMFKALFGKHRVPGGHTLYAVELAAPEGESTAGGKLALQHISLAPEGGGPTIVIGSANGAAKHAELRTHAHVAAQYGARFKGAAFPVQAAAHDELLGKLRGFFAAQQFTVVMMDVAPGAMPGAAPAPGAVDEAPARARGGALVLVAVAALVVGAILLLLKRG